MVAAVSADRIRVSVLADTLGVPFPDLFSQFCRTCPEVIDDDLTVPVAWLSALRFYQNNEQLTA